MAMVDRKSLHFGRSRVVSPLRQWTFPRESFLLIRILDSFRFVRIICSSLLPFLGPKSNSWRNPFFRLAEFNLVKGTSNFFYSSTSLTLSPIDERNNIATNKGIIRIPWWTRYFVTRVFPYYIPNYVQQNCINEQTQGSSFSEFFFFFFYKFLSPYSKYVSL